MTITKELVDQLLEYRDGSLHWKPRHSSWFSDGSYTAQRKSDMWNARKSGTSAGSVARDGYVYVRVLNRLYPAHRIIWLMETGAFPKNEIDHVNGIRTDNRIENLRPVTSGENNKNMKLPITNTSGHVGVYFNKSKGKWQAYISINNQSVYIGIFEDKEAAIAARKAEQGKHGFHENHGRRVA